MASEKENADPRKDVDDAYKATHFLGPIDDGLHDVVRPFQAEITLVSTPYFSTIGLKKRAHKEILMRLRTIRTFDEIEAFYTMIRNEYPDYSDPRLSPIHYGVFDVNENVKGWGEGESLVAGAAIGSFGWDILEPGGVTEVVFESLIVKPSFRNRGIGRALLNFIVKSHKDFKIYGEVSKKFGEWKWLISWYKQFSFDVDTQNSGAVYLIREPDFDDESDDDPTPDSLRWRASNRTSSEYKYGLDLSKFDL